jgi:hypothetical protein
LGSQSRSGILLVNKAQNKVSHESLFSNVLPEGMRALDTEQFRMVVSLQAHSQESEEQGNIMKQRGLLQQTSEVLVIAHSPAANALHGAQ